MNVLLTSACVFFFSAASYFFISAYNCFRQELRQQQALKEFIKTQEQMLANLESLRPKNDEGFAKMFVLNKEIPPAN